MVRAGVGRRRVQTAVMVLTTLLTVAASVLATGLLVASRAPFDDAFARQHGAHLTGQFDADKATAAQVRATAGADGVTAAAGPYAITLLRLHVTTAPAGAVSPPLTVAGRASAGGPVDDLDVTQGRWARAPGEIVIESGVRSMDMTVGARVRIAGEGSGDGNGDGPALTVVGIAESVGQSADGWVVPAQLGDLTAGGARPDRQMLYRLADAGTRGEVAAGRRAVAAAVPAGALTGTQSYLDIKQAAHQNTAAFIPFVTAFALLGLAMSVLIVSIVVSGAVGAATRRIGVLKSLGFTPPQIGRAYVAQAAIPAVVGAVLGAGVGNLLSVPLMKEVASAYGTGRIPIPPWVSLAVPAAVVALVAATALGPALRAARLRTTAALSVGRTPRAARGRRVRHALGRLPLPRAVGLGLAGPFARPARSATMAAAVTFGALAVTFAVGLGTSLIAVQKEGTPDAAGDVTVHRMHGPEPAGAPGEAGGEPRGARAEAGGGAGAEAGGDPGAAPEPPAPAPGDPSASGASPAELAAAIAARPETAHYFATAETDVGVTGRKGAVPLVTYRGKAPADGHRLAAGRWFAARGEAVAAARFLQATNTAVGDTVTLRDGSRTAELRIVGEVFDLGDEGMAVRTAHASVAKLVPDLEPAQYTVDLAPGTDRHRYLKALNDDLRPLGAEGTISENDEESPVILAMQALIAMLTAMLVAVACLGVLNTVVLDTRERVHDLGVFKALGMSPRQTVAMVLTSVAGIGLAAGAAGVPLGVALHHYVVPEMGRSVGTNIPDALVDIYTPAHLTLLALAGVAIATAGALLPATWAAATRTATALRSE
ncbi:ABC transporter permease [Streptomyces sp. WMMC500]|uniref:ABC transporter permease n=1 Tax=Streptomyces sp. WMMC500 TaxID=3015154 RepID=UPI00248ABE86|nr:ABC transporter permease [Streptomyces sp. WMMC500]WBB64474.1 ABC transporter permease [Streptomyces sp. WMMC500]